MIEYRNVVLLKPGCLLLEPKCGLTISVKQFSRINKDYYAVLGLKRGATSTQIKEAYYRRSKLVHPDVTGSQDAFVELKHAYDILRRPADRKIYDSGGKAAPKGKVYPYPHHPSYYARQGFYNGHDYRADWGNHFDGFQNAQKSMGDREKLHWRRIFWFTGIGLFAVTLYNFGYYMMLVQRAKEVEKMIAKDEIAKSFLRQREYRHRYNDVDEIETFSRVLKGDIDEAHQRRLEEMREKNRFEIRNPEQWMAAVREPMPPGKRERTRPPLAGGI